MTIATITTHILRVPLGERQFYSSQSAFPERTSCLVRIETTDGVVGWGEGGQWGPPEPVAAAIDHVLGPRLIGRDPTTPAVIWDDNYAQTRDFGQKGTFVEAISALDIALWDITGKVRDAPVAALLGGAFRDRVDAYATGFYYPSDFAETPVDPGRLKDEAGTYAGSGFSHLKVKVGLLSQRDDLERLRIIREFTNLGLMVDANHAYNAATAARLARAMEAFDVLWFEEPVMPEDRAGYREVRSKTAIPIAGGECEFTRYGFRDFIAGGAVDIIQPDLAASGGFSEFRNILALATAHHVATIPHVWGSGVALAAALQAIATIPPFPYTANPLPLLNAPMVEFDRSPNPLRDDLLVENFALENGQLAVPQGPGLGITINEDVLARYAA